MIAPPPGRGSWTKRAWALGIAGYLLALPAGAVLVGSCLYFLADVFGHPPVLAIGVVALASAVVGSGILPIGLPESGWRIPQSWGRFGHVTYSALFGGILGAGFLTAVPSIGFYTLLVWGLAADSWQTIVTVFGAFGLARALPLLYSAISAKRREGYPVEELDGLERLAKRVVLPVEVFVLAMIGGTLLVT